MKFNLNKFVASFLMILGFALLSWNIFQLIFIFPADSGRFVNLPVFIAVLIIMIILLLSGSSLRRKIKLADSNAKMAPIGILVLCGFFTFIVIYGLFTAILFMTLFQTNF